jgi:predicted RNase H-like HicB family nuclease
MNGLPHNAKVPLLGFSNTPEEAKQAASDVFDVWLERSGLVINPPTETH